KLTIGVMHRVEELADRGPDDDIPVRTPYTNLIPLNEIIAEALGKTPECQSVWGVYFRFIHEFGDEFRVLTEVPVSDLARLQPERVSQGIDRMRRGRVKIVPGHDGFYGVVRLFDEEGGEDDAGPQLSLF
ncbi:MAG: DNA helicase UvrD, partial [Candidatus Aminicenantales bacterium]